MCLVGCTVPNPTTIYYYLLLILLLLFLFFHRISNHTTVPSHRENKKEIKFTFTSQSSSTAAPETPFPSTEPVRHSRAHLPTSTRRRSALLLTPNLRRTGIFLLASSLISS